MLGYWLVFGAAAVIPKLGLGKIESIRLLSLGSLRFVIFDRGSIILIWSRTSLETGSGRSQENYFEFVNHWTSVVRFLIENVSEPNYVYYYFVVLFILRKVKLFQEAWIA